MQTLKKVTKANGYVKARERISSLLIMISFIIMMLLILPNHRNVIVDINEVEQMKQEIIQGKLDKEKEQNAHNLYTFSHKEYFAGDVLESKEEFSVLTAPLMSKNKALLNFYTLQLKNNDEFVDSKEFITDAEENLSVVEDVDMKEEKEEVQEDIYNCIMTGYSRCTLNIREYPSTESMVMGCLEWNEQISYDIYDDDWYVIDYNDNHYYVSREFIQDSKANYESKKASGDTRKSYMDWTCITSKSSPQYKLQHNYAYTESNGVRAVDGRYCIALGSFYTTEIGRYVDLVLENGTVIPCVIGDVKQDRHTTNNHSLGLDGGVAEFVVATNSLPKKARTSGDVSYASKGWDSNVVEVRIYDYNCMD